RQRIESPAPCALATIGADPLVVQHGVDAGGERPWGVEAIGIGARPGPDELAIARPAAVGARPVPCGERGGLVQEEELGPVAGTEHLATPAPEVQRAGDPRLAAPLRDDLAPVVVEDAAVAGPRAAGPHRLEPSEGCDAVLQGHGDARVGVDDETATGRCRLRPCS